MTQYSIKDVQNALATLKLHLPDPDEKLFIQLDDSKTLRNFTLFDKLSLELRLCIWRMCFPGPRSVGFHPKWFKTNKGPDYFPVTLQINSESRSDTYKHYYIIAHPFSNANHPPKLIIFNPRVDIIRIGVLELLFSRTAFNKFWSKLISRNRECFERIERLEIRDFRSSKADQHVRKLIYKDKNETSPLLLLPGLKEVTVTAGQLLSGASDAERLEPAKKFKEAIELLFEEYRSAFLTGKVPKVTARIWQILER